MFPRRSWLKLLASSPGVSWLRLRAPVIASIGHARNYRWICCGNFSLDRMHKGQGFAPGEARGVTAERAGTILVERPECVRSLYVPVGRIARHNGPPWSSHLCVPVLLCRDVGLSWPLRPAVSRTLRARRPGRNCVKGMPGSPGRAGPVFCVLRGRAADLRPVFAS